MTTTVYKVQAKRLSQSKGKGLENLHRFWHTKGGQSLTPRTALKKVKKLRTQHPDFKFRIIEITTETTVYRERFDGEAELEELVNQATRRPR